MFIDNARWDGVPFLLKAGKALETRTAEIRVQFRHVPGSLYRSKMGPHPDDATNELVRMLKYSRRSCLTVTFLLCCLTL